MQMREKTKETNTPQQGGRSGARERLREDAKEKNREVVRKRENEHEPQKQIARKRERQIGGEVERQGEILRE